MFTYTCPSCKENLSLHKAISLNKRKCPVCTTEITTTEAIRQKAQQDEERRIQVEAKTQAKAQAKARRQKRLKSNIAGSIILTIIASVFAYAAISRKATQRKLTALSDTPESLRALNPKPVPTPVLEPVSKPAPTPTITLEPKNQCTPHTLTTAELNQLLIGKTVITGTPEKQWREFHAADHTTKLAGLAQARGKWNTEDNQICWTYSRRSCKTITVDAECVYRYNRSTLIKTIIDGDRT